MTQCSIFCCVIARLPWKSLHPQVEVLIMLLMRKEDSFASFMHVSVSEETFESLCVSLSGRLLLWILNCFSSIYSDRCESRLTPFTSRFLLADVLGAGGWQQSIAIQCSHRKREGETQPRDGSRLRVHRFIHPKFSRGHTLALAALRLATVS